MRPCRSFYQQLVQWPAPGGPDKVGNEGNHKENHEDDEQEFRNPGRRDRNSRKAQNSGI